MTSRPKTTGEDIDRWLTSAEAVLDATSAELQRLSRLQTSFSIVATVVLIGAVGLAVRLGRGADIVAVTVAMLFAIGGGSSLLRFSSIRRKDVQRRRREMQSMVDDVREVYPIVARREEWSQDRYRSVRARLARFPVVAE